MSFSQYAARRQLQLVIAADFNAKMREMSVDRLTVQAVCKFARDEGDVRRILDYLWSDSSEALTILKELQTSNEDLYRFERMLETARV